MDRVLLIKSLASSVGGGTKDDEGDGNEGVTDASFSSFWMERPEAAESARDMTGEVIYVSKGCMVEIDLSFRG